MPTHTYNAHTLTHEEPNDDNCLRRGHAKSIRADGVPDLAEEAACRLARLAAAL